MNPYEYALRSSLKIDHGNRGYVYFMDKTHPLSTKIGKVYYHRHVASEKIGRWVNAQEVVHHVDGDVSNNESINLRVLTRREHARLNLKKKAVAPSGVMKESKVAGGRVAIYVPDHPKANNRGYVPKARYLIEQKIGRYLETDEHVHHKDGNKQNDSEENLEFMSADEHNALHSGAGGRRKLDYDMIMGFRFLGFGYKRIAEATGYPRSSVKSACRVMGV